jgi:hypothetical protein
MTHSQNPGAAGNQRTPPVGTTPASMASGAFPE